MRTKGFKCYNVKCGSCIGKTLCGEPADAALGCANRMVNAMTNADRIRAMTDEELAEWIRNGISSDACDYCEYNNGYCDGSPCRGKAEAETIVNWLQQSYGGADHE